MGNCGGICKNDLLQYKGDIKIFNLFSNNNEEIDYDIDKIIFLQRKIKIFLKLIHSNKKSRKHKKFKYKSNQMEDSDTNLVNLNGINNNSVQNKLTCAKSPTFKNSSLNKNSLHNESFQKENIIPEKKQKNRNNQNNKKGRSSLLSDKINSNINNYMASGLEINEKFYKSEYKENFEFKKEKITNNKIVEENNLNIQKLKPDLLAKKIFENDVFNIGVRNNIYENDPRDNLEDNIRKKYPKIVEGDYTYIGEWKNGKRDGLGLLYLQNGIKFMGYFSENKAFGYGHLWKIDGDSYDGYWRNYIADGWGIYKSNNGACYDGQWVNDLQHGFGIEHFPRGSIYFGDYEFGTKNGIGVLNFGNKAWYEGEFKNGVICGIGSFFLKMEEDIWVYGKIIKWMDMVI